jgi:hypothetical protein
MRLFDLTPQPSGKFFNGYDPRVIPTHRQGFMTAAFRFGHSLINDRLRFQRENGRSRRPRFRDVFNRPDPMYQPSGMDNIIRGLYTERCQRADRYVTTHGYILKHFVFNGVLKATWLYLSVRPTLTWRRSWSVAESLSWVSLMVLTGWQGIFTPPRHVVTPWYIPRSVFVPLSNLCVLWEMYNQSLTVISAILFPFFYVLCRLKTREITNYLFQIEPGTGTDLIARNINRARDHGVPPYMEFRRLCRLSTTNSFNGLRDHNIQTRRLFQRVYR